MIRIIVFLSMKFSFFDSFFTSIAIAYLKSKNIDISKIQIEKKQAYELVQSDIYRVMNFKQLGLDAPRVEKIPKH